MELEEADGGQEPEQPPKVFPDEDLAELHFPELEKTGTEQMGERTLEVSPDVGHVDQQAPEPNKEHVADYVKRRKERKKRRKTNNLLEDEAAVLRKECKALENEIEDLQKEGERRMKSKVQEIETLTAEIEENRKQPSHAEMQNKLAQDDSTLTHDGEGTGLGTELEFEPGLGPRHCPVTDSVEADTPNTSVLDTYKKESNPPDVEPASIETFPNTSNNLKESNLPAMADEWNIMEKTASTFLEAAEILARKAAALSIDDNHNKSAAESATTQKKVDIWGGHWRQYC